MKLKILEGRYCSPILVHALLVSACLDSDYGETQAPHGLPSELEKDFREEVVERLCRDVNDTEAASIITVQGPLYLCMALRLHEGDGLYGSYLTEAFKRCEALNRAHPPDGSGSELQEVLAVTCWDAYNLAATLGYVWQSSVHLVVPARPTPMAKQDVNEPGAYPLSIAESCYSRQLFAHRYDLSLAYHRYTDPLFTTNTLSTEEKVHELQECTDYDQSSVKRYHHTCLSPPTRRNRFYFSSKPVLRD
jgi:hypothetical protein